MTELDPFALGSDRTFVPPTPGGPMPTPGAEPPAYNTPKPAPPAAAAPEMPEIIAGGNPLVAIANPLLNLMAQLRSLSHHPDPGALRDYLVSEVQKFEQRAKERQIPYENVMGARYCLCTALDETAAQTPWGGSGAWSKHSLLVTFHNETWGGEKFFQLLSKLAGNPQKHKELLELMYYCIALGFEGRYRIVDNGRSQLETLKRRLVDIIRTARGEYERPLSPHWQGVLAMVRKAWTLIPLWVVGVVAGLLALLIYIWFSFSLAGASDPVFASIGNLRLPRVSISAPQSVVPQPARLARFLEPEIREGLVFVRDEVDRSVVVLRGDGLFDSGSTQVRDQYIPVISRIAVALNSVPGRVLVTGYTDNVPIRTLRFPSNWHLSQERALAVKAALESQVTTPGRISAEGRGEAEPVAPNDSAANKSRNRRVEIMLLIAPSEQVVAAAQPNVTQGVAK